MNLIQKLCPRFAILPLLSLVAGNTVAYYLSKMINTARPHYDIGLAVDDVIPYVPAFIVIYILAYIQWIIGYTLVCRVSKQTCYRVVTSELLAKIICMVFFLALPTQIDRPEVVGSGMFNTLTEMLYSMDTPTNLFPSIHCLESWILFRTASQTRLGKGYQWFSFVFALLVFASVVFVRQHFIVDIPAAIAVAELALWIGRRFRTERVFEAIERVFCRKEKTS